MQVAERSQAARPVRPTHQAFALSTLNGLGVRAERFFASGRVGPERAQRAPALGRERVDGGALALILLLAVGDRGEYLRCVVDGVEKG